MNLDETGIAEFGLRRIPEQRSEIDQLANKTGVTSVASLDLFAAMRDYKWVPDFFQPGDKSLITTVPDTIMGWTNTDGSKVQLIGSALRYNASGELIGGTINTVVVKDAAGKVLCKIDGLTQDAQNLFSFAFGYISDDGQAKSASGIDFLSALLNGDDTITGSNGSENIFGGRGGGNDTINARGGDDYIYGDSGSDTVDGGDGRDTITYDGSFGDFTSFQGITADLSTGVVVDCWGDTDTLLNVENIRGSKFGDSITGDAEDNSFMGLRGNDTIAGGTGFDEARYDRDARYGGGEKITVNLAAGTIRDGFGNTDIVSGIERVVGTAFNDKFIGSGQNDQFQGQAGKDSYSGGLGTDRVVFYYTEGQTSGAKVNLSLVTNQVLNDGFGNVETLSGIENLEGTEFKDVFKGDANDNSLQGHDGQDVLKGGAGVDRLEGDKGADKLVGGLDADTFIYTGDAGTSAFGDKIVDFVTGTDKLAFKVADFTGMDATVRFQVGTSAGGAGSWFYFDAADHGLYWDHDGTGGDAALKVATLSGVTTMVATDIELLV